MSLHALQATAICYILYSPAHAPLDACTLACACLYGDRQVDVIIIEGILVLHMERIRNMLNMKVRGVWANASVGTAVWLQHAQASRCEHDAGPLIWPCRALPVGCRAQTSQRQAQWGAPGIHNSASGRQ